MAETISPYQQDLVKFDTGLNLSNNGYQTLRPKINKLSSPSSEVGNNMMDSLYTDKMQNTNDYMKSLTNNQNVMSEYYKPSNTMSMSDVKGVGDFGTWLTQNRGGGSNYLDTGLKGLSAATSIYSAYNQNKYQNKMADLAEKASALQDRQQSIYEGQLARSNAKSDAAQKAYDDAQKQTTATA